MLTFLSGPHQNPCCGYGVRGYDVAVGLWLQCGQHRKAMCSNDSHVQPWARLVLCDCEQSQRQLEQQHTQAQQELAQQRKNPE